MQPVLLQTKPEKEANTASAWAYPLLAMVALFSFVSFVAVRARRSRRSTRQVQIVQPASHPESDGEALLMGDDAVLE